MHAEYKQCAGTTDLLKRLRCKIDGLHVIHIARPNYFDVLLSREVARKTGRWEQCVGSAPTDLSGVRIRIEPAAAMGFFEHHERADNLLLETFGGPLYRRVVYGDLAEDFSANMRRLYAFLGLEPITATESLEKQITRAPHELVDNYRELVSFFSNTRFSNFFSDLSAFLTSQVVATASEALPEK